MQVEVLTEDSILIGLKRSIETLQNHQPHLRDIIFLKREQLCRALQSST